MLIVWIKLIHVVSSTILFGTGLGSAYYMWRAYLSQDVNIIAHTTKSVVTADWIFTTTAVVVQFITGSILVIMTGYTFTTPWIILALILFCFVGVCWIPVVYIQIKLKALAHMAVQKKQPLSQQYIHLMRIWFILGWPAFISVLVIFYLMIFRPML